MVFPGFGITSHLQLNIMSRAILKNCCMLKANDKGHLAVYMPDGKEIPNTSGRTIEQGLSEARAGVCMVKLNIFCMVSPDDEPLDFTEQLPMKSLSEVEDKLSEYKSLLIRCRSHEQDKIKDLQGKIESLSWVLGR
jgi:hypothetical protein